MKRKKMMVNNSTNMEKKPNNYLSHQIIEHKKEHAIGLMKSFPGLGQSQIIWQGKPG